MLGIDSTTYERYGPVSKELCELLADRVKTISDVDIGVAELGVAGPNKRRTGEPVGLCYIAVSY